VLGADALYDALGVCYALWRKASVVGIALDWDVVCHRSDSMQSTMKEQTRQVLRRWTRKGGRVRGRVSVKGRKVYDK